MNTVLSCGIPAASLERKAAKIPESFAVKVQAFATSDIRSVDLIDSFPLETLDDRRRCAKSILMYKIMIDYIAPGLWRSFVNV